MRLYRIVLEMSLAFEFHFFARPEKKKNRVHTNWNITSELRGAMKFSVNQSSARVHMLQWQGNHAKH